MGRAVIIRIMLIKNLFLAIFRWYCDIRNIGGRMECRLVLAILLAVGSYTKAKVMALIPTNQKLFEGRTILVIGGTGYLGRALTGEILRYNPKKIIIYSRDEVKHLNVSNIFGKDKVQCVIGDVRDYQRLTHAMKGVDIVFHVAALKRMDDAEYNAEEALKTNAVASLNVFYSCVENNVEKVLFISTDKACLPINVYGACKFLSEKIFTNYDKSKIKTTFMVTRFGNILDSTGSVIPIFIEKIKKSEDITLTDERMTRFIISKREATELIFDALRYGRGGEIFIPKMPAMKITDLIEIIKDVFGKENKTRIIGLRPGEKLHEILFSEFEAQRAYEYKNRYVITPSIGYQLDEAGLIPNYIESGEKLSGTKIHNYSSEDRVVEKERLKEILQQLNLLNVQ